MTTPHFDGQAHQVKKNCRSIFCLGLLGARVACCFAALLPISALYAQKVRQKPQSAWDSAQDVQKKVNLLEMVAKSFVTAIDAGDLKGAFEMVASRPVFNAKPSDAKAQKETDFQEFTTCIRSTPAFGPRKAIHYGDVLLSDSNETGGEVHARVTTRSDEYYDILWKIHEVSDGWKVEYFVVGRRFPPNYPTSTSN